MNLKYLSRNTGRDELVSVLAARKSFRTVFFIFAKCCADARAWALWHAHVFVGTFAVSSHSFGHRLLIGERRTRRHGTRRGIKRKNATQFIFGCVQVASGHSGAIG